MPRRLIVTLLVFGVFSGAPRAVASFHIMQIEQVIGGVNGDATAQAIQLRMRTSFQNQLEFGQLVAFDANGNNPVTLIAMNHPVASSNTGDHVLIATSSFLLRTTPTTTPDFTMSTPIPASYLAAGSLIFTDGFNIYWRVSWGGANYHGTGAGSLTNDADGNFNPPFAQPLPSSGVNAVQFRGVATDPSTNNQSDYTLTSGGSTWVNNAGSAFTLSGGVPTCNTCHGDTSGDSHVDGDDVQSFIACLFNGNISSGNCPCADMDSNGSLDSTDMPLFVSRLLGISNPDTTCP